MFESESRSRSDREDVELEFERLHVHFGTVGLEGQQENVSLCKCPKKGKVVCPNTNLQ